MNTDDENKNYNKKNNKFDEKRNTFSPPPRRFNEGYQPEPSSSEISKPKKIKKVIKSPDERNKEE